MGMDDRQAVAQIEELSAQADATGLALQEGLNDVGDAAALLYGLPPSDTKPDQHSDQGTRGLKPKP
ncbi:hypothetical protein [Bailinhaonella thermotolerans]|uniref:hypothetical protein n=1 Tax=Bailinhaonella thermotolerans TaxID=1070861 RepID=UPI0011C41F7A|nr:hypothetical protein [Bailinhaonella thermotolerans]